MNLFIDTNILLSFYHFTGDDLEELKKLVVLLEKKKVQLYVPTQVIAEFRRNREPKIADALKTLREQRLNLHFPQVCKDYPEYEQLRKLQKEYEASHAAILNKLDTDINGSALKADKIIDELFELAVKIDCDTALVARARTRFDLGNPPGKDGSLGDAVNWEALLQSVPDSVDLHFVSDDRDYCSALDTETFSRFLGGEWGRKKKSSLVFYKRMSGFFKEHFPDIKVAAELEKDLAIQDFVRSGSFAKTHAAVAHLGRYDDFTPEQVNLIIHGAANNSQISSIIDDPDVSNFITSLVEKYEKVIDHGTMDLLKLFWQPSREDDDIPF